MPTPTNSWVMRPRPRPQAHMRLFCFPYAGGGAFAYRPWTEQLASSIEVCPVQLPGRENRLRESPFTRVTPLVDALLDELDPYLDMPYALFGHSMGALIAFELARRLQQENRVQPAHLFVSARPAPHYPAYEPQLHGLPDEQFVEQLRRLNGTSDAVLQNAELMRLLLPVLRADFSVNERYIYVAGDALDTPITALGGSFDDRASPESIKGWQLHTRRDFHLHLLPADHFFVNSMRSQVLHRVSDALLPLLSTPAAVTLPLAAPRSGASPAMVTDRA